MTDEKVKLPTKDEIKRMAYRMKIEQNLKISFAYETIAKQYGFKTYAAMHAAMKEQHRD